MKTENLTANLEKYSKEQLIKIITQIFTEYRVMKKRTDPVADVVAYFGEGVTDK